MPLVESAFKTSALSRTKARGVWQFMSGTAAGTACAPTGISTSGTDPEKATVAAARYLKSLGGLFDNDWHLALASYNSGPGRVQKAMKRLGGGDFWALSAKPKLLRRRRANTSR